MHDKDRFIEECRQAASETDPQAAVREIVARAISDPAGCLRVLGEPVLAGIETLYHGEDLTILDLAWGPQMNIHPHDHRMWAVIGLYGGREDNTFWRRGEGGHGLVRHGMKTAETGDAVPLGESVIHSVTNPLDRITAAIHVYGGDFFSATRSEWTADTHVERPYDVENTRAAFAASNERLRELQAG